MFDLLKFRVIAYAIGAAAALSTATYFIGRSDGQDACELAHKAASVDQLKTDAAAIKAQTQTSNEAGRELAKAEQTVQTHTQYLTREVIKYVPKLENSSASGCGINADSVRIWNAANRGDDVTTAASP